MGGLHVQGPVRPDIVGRVFTLSQLAVMLFDIQRDIHDFIELFATRPMTALDPAVERPI